jgi:mitogen-activated protein kinase kinase
MLLQHAWLAPLIKPDVITEEDEEAAEAAESQPAQQGADAPEGEAAAAPLEEKQNFVDREVGEWVRGQIEKKRNGTLGKKAKPALHAAPLNVTSSPKSNKGAVAV